MSEPTYTYVPGQGWVVFNYPYDYSFETSGGRWLLINRLPQPGQQYAIFSKNTTDGERWLINNEVVNIEKFGNYIKASNFQHSDHYGRANDDFRPSKGCVYCTLIFEPYV